MNKLPLFVAVFFTIADAATSALAIDAVRDRPATLPEVRVQVIQRAAMDTIIMSPAERATLRCLEATNRVLAFSNGRVIHITIGLPDPDLLEMLNTATASIGRAVPSERAEAPPTPQHPSSGDDYEAVRRLLSPSGDWSAKTFNHLSTLKGQVARLVTVEEAIGELGAAAHALLLASEVQDARPWPDERSIIIYLERPEACKDASLGSFLENTVANVGAQVESLDILDSVAKILLSVDTTASQILPLSSLSYHEVCGSEDGVGMGGVACGRRFHRLLFPFYADREDEVVQGRTTGQSLRTTRQFNELIGRNAETARERRQTFADHAKSDAQAVLPNLLALVSRFESEKAALTAFRGTLDREKAALEEMAQEIILGKDRLTRIALEVFAANAHLATLGSRLVEIDDRRHAARERFDNAKGALAAARGQLSLLGTRCEAARIGDCGNPAVREAYDKRKHDAYETINSSLNEYLDLQKVLLELNEQYFDARRERSELVASRSALLAERSKVDIKVDSSEIQHSQRSATLGVNENRYGALWPAHVEDRTALEKALALSRELAGS